MDSAVGVFANSVERALDEVEGKNKNELRNKRDAVLRRYIPELAKARRFADPGKR